MTIFNYKIVSYKKFMAFAVVFSILVGSASLLFQKAHVVDAAITDCTTIIGNLITNCSFENPTGVLPLPAQANTPTQDILDTTYTGITGWTTIDDGGKQGNIGVIHNDLLFPALQGVRLIDVSGHTSSPDYIEKAGMLINQTLSGLTIGETYEVKFAQGYSTFLQPSKVTVLIDGTPSVEGVGGFNVNNATAGTTNLGSNKWKEQRTTFVATAASMTIGFRGEVTGSGRGDFIDNVIVKLVPDIIPPILTLSPAITTVSGPFTVTVCTSEPLATTPVAATLELTDFNVTNGTASGLSGPTTGPSCPGGEIYTVTITPTIVVDGTITVSIPSGAATDPTGNSSTTANSVTATYDVVTVIISPVHIQTDNGTNNQFGTTGNTITLTYTTDIDITTAITHTVTIGGQTVVPSCIGAGPSICTATLPVTASIPTSDGLAPFSIIVDSQTTTATTDLSSVTIDRTINVVINTPGPTDDLSTFLIGGQCEIGAGNVTLSGSGFSPSPVTTPCDSFGYFEYEPVTGTPGTITITATQTDLAGNVGTDTNIYTLAVPVLPAVTISGPSGVTAIGPNIITGTCTTSAGNVTINGAGFLSTLGALPATIACTGGTYSLPITIVGTATITASQTNGVGTATANAFTTLPGGTTTIVTTGGGCMPGYPCSQGTSSVPSPVVSTPTISSPSQNPSVSSSCPAFTQYLKKGARDGKNGISEVSKVQEFLNRKFGLGLVIDGVFGKRTHRAVSDFQSTYFTNVLSPWGLIGPTGWWYQSTRSYANYLEGCTEGVVRLDNTVRIQDGMIVN